MPAPLRFGRGDWVDAASALVAEQGFEALAVEAVARRLGATKGSFYHHFSDRAALVEAVLDDWVAHAYTAVVDDVERAPEPERLADLIAISLGSDGTTRDLEWAILAATDDPRVAVRVDSVHRRRMDYLTELFRSRGLGGATARARGRVCYAAYLGNMLLLRGQPDRRRSRIAREAAAAFRAELLAMITARGSDSPAEM